MNAPAAQIVETRLPSNVEAEAALLGAMMTANVTIDRVADIVGPEHFFEPIHGRIFSAIVKEHGQGKPANPVTLKPYFEGDEAMKEVGGAAYMAQLTGSGAAVIGVNDFAQQIFDLAQRRTLIARLKDALAAAHDTSEDIGNDVIVADLEVAISEVTRLNEDGAVELSAGACLRAAIEGMERKEQGVLSGIAPIDEAIGPIYRKDLVIKAGRPGMGKTAEAISYSLGAARRGHGILFVSLEMSAEQIGQRMACDWAFDSDSCQIPYDKVVDGNLNQAEFRQLCRAQEAIDQLPIQVIDASNLTVQSLARIVRRWKRRFTARGLSLDLVIVDYLQKLRAHGLTNRFEIVTEISQTLKEIAKGNDLGVMALAQLGRKVEEREDKRPHLADLRESGQIEQDADVVCFLYRAEYYLEQSEPPAYDEGKRAEWQAAIDAVRSEIEFICAKRRKGKPGATRGRFYGAFQAVRGAYA